jgi:hypothetical protein
MRFLYQGFTHDGDTRLFTFQGIDEQKVETLFFIKVNLSLLARNKLAVQDAPGFCLQLLTNACGPTPDPLEKLRQYSIMQEDLAPVLVDRERRARLKSFKSASRRFVRKPSEAPAPTAAVQLAKAAV